MSNQEGPQIVIVNVGACGAHGLTTRQLAMSMRAQRSAQTSQTPLRDRNGRPLRLASVSALPDDLHGYDRLFALASMALREAYDGTYTEPLPILLALPEPEALVATTTETTSADSPHQQPRSAVLHSGSELMAALAKDCGVPLDRARSAVVERGNAAGAIALELAVQLLTGQHSPRAVIVGGVDSYHDPQRIQRLAATGRLGENGEEPRMIPGEGAAFLVIERRGAPAPRSMGSRRDPSLHPLGAEHADVVRPSLAAVLDVHTRDFTPASPEPTPSSHRATGKRHEDPELVEVIRHCTAKASTISWIMTDTTGDIECTEAWLSAVREALPKRDDVREDAMAAQLGDVGAASGPMFAAIACAHWHLGAVSEPCVLVALSSADGARGGFLMERCPRKPPGEPAPVSACRSAAHDIAVAARGVLDRIRLELQRMLPRMARRDRDVVAAELKRTDRALAALTASDLLDRAHLDRLEESALALEQVAAAVGQRNPGRRQELKLGAERIQLTIGAISNSLRSVRVRVVDQMLEASGSQTAAATTLAPLADPAQASIGVPSIYTFPGVEGGAADARVWGGGELETEALRMTDDEEEEGEEGEEEERDDAEGVLETPKNQDAALGTSRVPATPAIEHLREAAWSAFETIGRLGLLRRPSSSVPWSPELGDFDQRLLDQLDLLAALASPELSPPPAPRPAGYQPALDVLAELTRYTRAQHQLPEVAFARTLVLGCTAGGEAPRAAVASLRQAHPRTLDAHASALKLASNPTVSAAVEELCFDAKPELVSLAMDVLRARRSVRLGIAIPPLFHPDPRVRAEAARALAHVPERDEAASVLELAAEREDDDLAAAAMLESLVRLRSPVALDVIRDRLDRGAADASTGVYARLLALAGGTEDVERLASPAHQPGGIVWLGWCGRASAVESLLQLLEASTDSRWPRAAEARAGAPADGWTSRLAARALQRITGAVSSRKANTPVLVQADLHTTRDELIEVRPAMWRTYWEAEGHRYASAIRYRFGRPYRPAASLLELREGGVLEAHRKTAALEFELSSATSVHVPETEDWVARQLAALNAAIHAA